jgi:hypothetical protein
VRLEVKKVGFRKIVILIWLITTLVHSGRAALPKTLINSTRRSPDGRWEVRWQCQETPTAKCNLHFSRVSDGSVVFQHSTFPRFIRALWNRTSTKCLLLDAPDNASTFLWLFRIQKREVAVEKLDYEAIGTEIERTRPEARQRDPHSATRSGIEKIRWDSDSQLRLDVIYNNVHVIVRVDTSNPNRPRITVVS